MARWEMRDLAALPELLPKTRALSRGARKLLRPIRTLMRFALVHCITFGLMPTNRQTLQTRQ
jgi:hypothetical protein